MEKVAESFNKGKNIYDKILTKQEQELFPVLTK